MKGLRRRIMATIAEVEYEIKVNLGLVEPITAIQKEIELVFDLGKEEIEEEWPEVKAFEKLLDEIILDCTEFNTILTECQD
ncbi:MAG: hypothetical protein LBU51_02115 [Bacteroidales bacterium]|jgi:hypothetical protein|nr:hypothetical protein [Bacteroidales bacterium]